MRFIGTGAWLLGLVMGPGGAIALGPAATRPRVVVPSGPPQPTEFSLRILDIVGPRAELENTPADALIKKVDADHQRRMGANTFEGRLDLAVPTRLRAGVRVPRVKSRPRGGAVVDCELVGAVVEVSGAWQDDHATVHLKVRADGFGPSGLPTEPDTAQQIYRLDRTFDLVDGSPVAFKFQDRPIPGNDFTPDTVRLQVGLLTVKRPSAEASAASPADSSVGGSGPTLLEVEVLALSARSEATDPFDLAALVKDAPASSVLLERMYHLGGAYRACEFRTTWDSTARQRFSTQTLLPDTQRLAGTAKPTVSLADAELRFETQPGRWERRGENWCCEVAMKCDISSVSDWGEMALAGIQLPPKFSVSFDGRRRFESGRSEYFVYPRAFGYGSQGRATCWVVRVALTCAE